MNLNKDLVYSLDPVRFAIDCLNFRPDVWQTEVIRSHARRMLLNCSRQSGELFRKVTDFIKQLDSRPELTEDNKLSLQLNNNSRIVSLPSTDRKSVV